MSTLTNSVVSIDVDSTENWTIQVNDTDLNGDPISHVGDQLLAEIKDSEGNIVFTAESGDELSIAGGTTNGIVLSVPWSVVKDLPAATYYASLVVLTDENNRTKIIDLELRHSVL
jgi:hypothetical protein